MSRHVSRPAGEAAGIIVLALLLALACLLWLGYDLTRLSDSLIGGNTDAVVSAWSVYQAVENLRLRPLDLGYSPLLHPDPASFAASPAPYGIAISVLPLYLLAGGNWILTYNLYWIVTFALTAFGAYLLARYLLGASWAIALFVGLLVAFAPYRLSNPYCIDMLSTHLLLLALYSLHRLLDAPSRGWTVVFAVTGWLAVTSSPFLLMAWSVTSVTVSVFYAVRHGQLPLRWLAIAVVAIALFSWPFYGFRLHYPAFVTGGDYAAVLAHSAMLEHWLIGSSQVYVGLMSAPLRLFPGFIPLVLAALAWRWRYKSNMQSASNLPLYEVMWLYALLAIIGFVLSLGPELRLGDHTLIPMPTLILIQIPGFSAVQYPADFALITIIGLSTLGAAALVHLRSMYPANVYRVLVVTLAMIALIEYVPANNNTAIKILDARAQAMDSRVLASDPLLVDTALNMWLAQQPPETAVLHYPANIDADYRYIANLPAHHQPMLNGARSLLLPVWYREIDWEQFPQPDTMTLLVERGVRYVAVHRNLMLADAESQFMERWNAYIAQWGALPLVTTIDEVDLYRVVPPRQVEDPDVRAEAYRVTIEALLAESRCFEAAIEFEQARTQLPSFSFPIERIEACNPLGTRTPGE